jgi:hypothetical protein
MAFRCENCSQGQQPGTKPIRRVIATRSKEYNNGGQGWEVVKEVLLCETCETRVVDAAAMRRG